MDRGRGRRYDDRNGGNYGGRDYRGGRSPPRRDDRPRSRSPRRRSPKDDYRERQRTPPRDYNDRPRSPYRRRSRSAHGRDRSPIRSRNDPPSYRDRSPARGGRYQDDRDRYGRRDYQGRDPPRRFPMENNYRPGERTRSPPRRSTHGSREDSPRSQPLSRRASPPERARTPPREPAFNDSRNDRSYYSRDATPPRRARTPPRDPPAYRDRSPLPREDSYRDRSPPRQQDDGYLPDADYERDTRNDHGRDGPPTGPSYRGEPVPADSRHDTHRESARGGRHGSGSYRQSNDAPSGPRSGGQSSYDSAPHSGRWPAQTQQQNQSRWENRAPIPAFRGSSNSTATTYPRTQRFNTGSHLAGVPSVVEGGKKQPSAMDPEHEKRLQQLEDEKKKLEAMIEEKQRKKRSDLRDWEKLEREAKSSQLRSELAEGHLERLSDIGATISY